MFKHCLNMEMTRNVSKWGNSAGVLLPREMLGSQVKIIQVERKLNIKEEIIRILNPYLDEIIGIYLTGSYARDEQNSDSDVDVIVISKSLRKEIIFGKYHIIISTLDTIKHSLTKTPILVLPRLKEAKTIINSSLLSELLSIKSTKKSFRSFIEECKRIIKINRGFIELDKDESENVESEGVVYSLILRLRGIFMMNCILKSKNYSKRDFLNYLYKNLGTESNKIYSIYSDVRDDKKVSSKISIKTALILLNLVKKEVSNYGK